MDLKVQLIDNLNRIRNNQQLWQTLTWKKKELSPKKERQEEEGKEEEDNDDEDNYWDENSPNRTKVVLALQWDLQPTDEALLQFLLKEEIRDREADPFQGGSDTLRAGGYLLASFKNPANVWLFAQVKSANFDTHCGFDYEYMLSAGVEATFAYVTNQENDYKDYFHEFFPDLANCSLNQQDMDKWHQGKADYYLQTPPDDDYKYWFNVALELDDVTTAKTLLARLEAQSDKSLDTLQILKYYKERVNDSAGAIALMQKILTKKGQTTLGNHTNLVRLHIQNDDPNAAWQILQQIPNTFGPLGNYHQKSLYMLAIEIALASTGSEKFAMDAYQYGMNNINQNLPLTDLEKHLQATQHLEDKASEAIVRKLYDAEKKRIDEMMDRLKG